MATTESSLISSAQPAAAPATIRRGGLCDLEAVAALSEVGFAGVLIPDHIPHFGRDPRVETAYTIGTLQAMLAGVTAAAV